LCLSRTTQQQLEISNCERDSGVIRRHRVSVTVEVDAMALAAMRKKIICAYILSPRKHDRFG